MIPLAYKMEELRTLLSETPILSLKDAQDEVLSLEHNNTVGDALKVIEPRVRRPWNPALDT